MIRSLPCRLRSARILSVATSFVLTTAVLCQAQAPQSAAEFFPKTTAVYVHVEQPAELIETIETHPVVQQVLDMKEIKTLMRSPQFAMAMLGRGFLESQIEETLVEALKTNMAKGLWVGVDPATDGVAVVFHSRDEKRLKRVAGQILKLVSTTATNDGKKAPFKKDEYRGAVAAKFDDFLVARYKSWFMLTNKSDFAKQIVDNMIDGTDEPLADQTWFKKALAQRQPSDVWAAVDLETVRNAAKNAEPFIGRTDNPGVELIFGGILDSLQHTPVALGGVSINEGIDVTLSTPFDKEWANDAREFFFGKDLGGLAPRALKPKNLIASLTSYRDVGLWWLSKEELYAEKVIAQLAQADSQLSTIFSGMDFGQDVLGSLEPGVQIIVTENQYDEKYIPDIKIPAFALVGKLKDPDKLRRKLGIAFQSVVGFANINLGMNGQPQLETETETIGETKVKSASYYYEDGTEEGLILFNFTPTIAFQGSNLILASSRDLAVELAELSEQASNENEGLNTRIQLDGQALHKILEANRESLVAQNMLEEGNERKAAETQIDLVLTIADLFREANLDYEVTPEKMQAKFSVRFEHIRLSEAAK